MHAGAEHGAELRGARTPSAGSHGRTRQQPPPRDSAPPPRARRLTTNKPRLVLRSRYTGLFALRPTPRLSPLVAVRWPSIARTVGVLRKFGRVEGKCRPASRAPCAWLDRPPAPP